MHRIRFLSASGSVEHSVRYGRGFCAGCSGARFVRVHWLRSSTQITEVGTLRKILLLACKSVARRQMKSLKLLRMRSPRMAIVTFLAPLGADFHLSRLFGFLQTIAWTKKESDALELVDDWRVIAICEDVPVRQEAIKKQFFNIVIFFARRGDQVHESANPCLT